jgi:sterol desaturase/sphingolipid hydroxylase (fatty acid hydroxylase superfamily)
MLLSLAIKAAAIFLIGASAFAVLIFEVALNLTSMFSHSNVRMPRMADAVLRWFIVTPDMHRVHHSVYGDETNRNFGFNLPWWDRIFGTYRGQPRSGHEQMTIGIPSFRSPRQCITLRGILSMPFVAERNTSGAKREDLPNSSIS